MIVAPDYDVPTVIADNKSLVEHVGEFLFPSDKGGAAPVFLG